MHGPSGVGKSRLLAALVAECLLRRPGSAVAHLEAEAFAAACAEAAGQAGGWAELRERFRRLDLFVLEDLHALERAPLALTELVHTLDALDEAGAAVAVSARSGPGQWSGAGWPPRLVNRLVGGLAVRVDPPGLASRRRFVLERARARGLALSAEAVEALAAAGDGYRTLDGWLARLALTGRLGQHRRPLEPSLVAALLEEEETEAAGARVTIEQVARAVAEHFGVRLGDLRGATRRQTIVAPRHLAMHLARTADRPELPSHRRLLRPPRPRHGPPRLPRRRRPTRRRSGPRRRGGGAEPPLATDRVSRRRANPLSLSHGLTTSCRKPPIFSWQAWIK